MDSTSRVIDAPVDGFNCSDAEDTLTRQRILFIAYEFPPLGGAGIRRSLILTRHLPAFGIDPIVLTTDLPSFERDKCELVDTNLLERIPPGLTIERIPTRPPRLQLKGKLRFWMHSLFVLTDTVAERWQAEVKRRLPELISKYQPAAVYVTLPPFSLASLACSIGNETGLPVILDFRDSWSQCGHTPYMSWLHYRLLLRIERTCLEQAAAVVCVTEDILRDMISAQPSVDRAKFYVIPNGLDGKIPATIEQSRPERERPFVIGHVGSFYYSPPARQAMLTSRWRRKFTRWTHFSPRKEDWLYRSPYFFFRALAMLFEQKPHLRPQIRVRFVGTHPPWLSEQVREFGLQDAVEFLGYLNHEDCLAFQAACDCLLITSAKVLGGRDYCISSKTFEYVAAGKPILAVVACGAQRDFLLKSGVARVCDPDDAAATASQIDELMSGRGTFEPNAEFLAQFSGDAISRSLAQVVREVAEDSFRRHLSKSH